MKEGTKFPTDSFGIPKPDAVTQLMGITADVASLQAAITAQNSQILTQSNNVDRRLASIETAVNKIEKLTELVLTLQSQVSGATRRVDSIEQWKINVDSKLDGIADHGSRLRECEVRVESIHHNSEILTGHEYRLTRIETLHKGVLGGLKASLIWLIGIAGSVGLAILASKYHINLSSVDNLMSLFR